MKFKPDILYEDNHILIVNKPAGMLTQGDSTGRISLLEHLKVYIKERDSKPGNVFLGMVQRLDKPVSGALVFGKTSKGAKRISEQIRDRRLTKCYLAVTAAAPVNKASQACCPGEWRELTHRLCRVRDRSFVDDQAQGGQMATMQVKTLLLNKHFGFHAIRLVTGRKHQIRVQLSALGMPICGDQKYGSQTLDDHKRILLHSYLLRLDHPTRKTLVETLCPLPPELLTPFDSWEQNDIESALAAEQL